MTARAALSRAVAALAAVFVFGGCELPPPSHSPYSSTTSGASASTPAPSAAPAPAPEPDGDGDGIPDRCDACPGERGALWDDFPSIDGCATGTFHSLVRESEGTVLEISFPPGSSDLPAGDELARVIAAVRDSGADSLAVVGRAGPAEPRPHDLARARARRLSEALRAGGVQASVTLDTDPAASPSVQIAVLSRRGEEELRRVDGRFEHVRAAAARERRERARGAPSPCGRAAGGPIPPR